MKHPLRLYENFKCVGQGDTTLYWYYKLMNLAIVRYEWKNLPPQIEPMFIEQSLFYNSIGAFVVDDVTNIPAFFNVNLTGNIDIYDFPEERQAYASNGYWEMYGKDNSVIVRDNPTMFPLCWTTMLYAQRLNNLWRTIDLNVYCQRTPTVIACTQDTRLSYEILSKKYESYVPVIKVADTMDLDKFKALSLGAPYVADKLQDQIRYTLAQYLTDLGYNNNAQQKKERLVSSETEGNNGEIEASRNVGLVSRKRCAKQCNKLFGWNVDVVFRSDLLDEFSAELRQNTLSNLSEQGANAINSAEEKKIGGGE